MGFRKFREAVKESVKEAMASLELEPLEFQVTEPPRSDFGDLSVSVSFALGKKLGKAPIEIANSLFDKIDLTDRPWIKECFVLEPGYLNFRADLPMLAVRTLLHAGTDKDYGSVSVKRGPRVLVEHTSVNPNKALHIGHLRNLVLGDSVSRILTFTGSEVKVLNYIDDSGLQVADIIVGLQYANLPSEPPGKVKYDQYVGGTVYVKVNELYEKTPSLLDRRREILKALEDPKSKTSRFAKELTTRVLKEQLKTCWRAGAKYDLINRESDILTAKLWDHIFQKLKEEKLAEYVSEGRLRGCWVARGDYEGDEKVLVRSDGTATYMAKDVPYAAWKIGLLDEPFTYSHFLMQPDGTQLWSTGEGKEMEEHPRFHGADLAITVIDVTQSRLQRIISQLILSLGGDEARENYVHLSYEVVSLSGKTAKELGFQTKEVESLRMSGRKGVFVNADDLLQALYQKSYEETKSRNPDADEEWLRSTAEKVGVGAIRFELLKQDLDKRIVFDFNRALDLKGETGPYIQYAHARASRILEKARGAGHISPNIADSLKSDSEINLLKMISKFDIMIEEAAVNLSPKIIARYCYSLATAFNVFYENNPVLREIEADKKAIRLKLVQAFENTSLIGLNLLGISAPIRI